MRKWVSVLLGVGLLSSCDAEPSGPTDWGQLSASIAGDIVSSYEGTGQFTLGHNSRAPQRPAFFHLRSTARGKNESFSLRRSGSQMPAPGHYKLGQTDGFTGSYDRIRDGVRERFAATSGNLEITSVGREGIQGSFDFTAVLICTGTINLMTCRVPATSDAVQIEVKGSFRAVEGDGLSSGIPGF